MNPGGGGGGNLNEDTAFYRQMEPGIADKYIRYPSYREFLDYYLWFLNQHIPTIRKSQGGSNDWRQTFDELSPKTFQPKSKQILLETLHQRNRRKLFGTRRKQLS